MSASSTMISNQLATVRMHVPFFGHVCCTAPCLQRTVPYREANVSRLHLSPAASTTRTQARARRRRTPTYKHPRRSV